MTGQLFLSYYELHAVKNAMKKSNSRFKKQILERLLDEIAEESQKTTFYYLQAESCKFGKLENGINFQGLQAAEKALYNWKNSNFFKGKDFEFKIVKKRKRG